jgi:Toprim-like
VIATVPTDVIKERLKQAYLALDIPAEIEKHTGIRLSQPDSKKQYNGACPFPDCSADTNGFVVFPDLSERGKHYLCRICKRSGDIVGLLREACGMTFSDACKALGIPNPYREDGDVFNALKPVRRRVSKIDQWQLDELQCLTDIYERAKLALRRDRARAYLQERGIPFETAEKHGLGYIPALSDIEHVTPELERLRRWCDRIIFPIQTPDGQTGYCGRSLFLWETGIDEDEHKRRIDAYNLQMKELYGDKALWHQMPRWKYTYQQGFFNWQCVKDFSAVVFVEGPFDVLALAACGLQNAVSIGTSSLNADALPSSVYGAIVALDIDTPGRKAAKQLETGLRRKGLDVVSCVPADGKDWSAEYRLNGMQGLSSLLKIADNWTECSCCHVVGNGLTRQGDNALCAQCFARLVSMPSSEETMPTMPSSEPTGEPTEYLAVLEEPALCGTCLDGDIETPGNYEHDGFMYCENHHPQRVSLLNFVSALAIPEELNIEVYHVSQREAVKQRVQDEFREEQRKAVDAKIYQVAEQRRRAIREEIYKQRSLVTSKGCYAPFCAGTARTSETQKFSK